MKTTDCPSVTLLSVTIDKKGRSYLKECSSRVATNGLLRMAGERQAPVEERKEGEENILGEGDDLVNVNRKS